MILVDGVWYDMTNEKDILELSQMNISDEFSKELEEYLKTLKGYEYTI